MSGHSKWANIKHKKAREDAKRGKVFTKLIREITVAARIGGGDSNVNTRLRLVIDKARSENMPQDNIARAVKKGTGEIEGATYEASIYEGYGPGGIAVMIETLSDNKNRTVAALRHIFSKMGGSLGENGSVAWMFEHKGVVMLQKTENLTDNDVLEKLIEYNIDDVFIHDETISVICEIRNVESIKKAAEGAGFQVLNADIEWVPKSCMSLTDTEEEKAYKFLESMEDLDDVQDIYTNLE